MFKIYKLFLLLFLLTSCATEVTKKPNDFYKKATLLDQKSDTLSIEAAIELFKEGHFSMPMENKVFYEIKGEEATWLHVTLPNISHKMVLTIWNNFLDFSKVYVVSANGQVKEKETFSLLESHAFPEGSRKPIWTFSSEDSKSHVFVKIKDFNLKTNLNIFLLDSESHHDLLQKESTIILLQAFFLGVLFIFIFLIYIARKKVSLLWYAIYILFFLFEYLFHMGVHNEFGVLNYPILQSSSQVFIPNNAMLFACLFFIQFYNYNQQTKWVQKIFQFLAYYFVSVAGIFMVFFAFDKILFPKEIIIYSARFAIICILILHVFLAIKKTIPYYLAVAFNLPIISFFVFITDTPTYETSFSEMLLFDNLLYAATSAEICIVLFYIVKSLMKYEFIAVKLNNENLSLRNSFNEAVFEAQELERNKLLENVHDSFGGYLEALKLRLLYQQEENSTKIKEILDSFYNEYRYLLNNLYAPKINATNLSEHIHDFVLKQNHVTNNIIQEHINLTNVRLSTVECINLYRIICELITNAIKHARASQISLDISNSKGVTQIIVSDNGNGFDQNKINKNSYGLRNVEKRIATLKGTIEFTSQLNKGTKVTIIIPENEQTVYSSSHS